MCICKHARMCVLACECTCATLIVCMRKKAHTQDQSAFRWTKSCHASWLKHHTKHNIWSIWWLTHDCSMCSARLISLQAQPNASIRIVADGSSHICGIFGSSKTMAQEWASSSTGCWLWEPTEAPPITTPPPLSLRTRNPHNHFVFCRLSTRNVHAILRVSQWHAEMSCRPKPSRLWAKGCHKASLTRMPRLHCSKGSAVQTCQSRQSFREFATTTTEQIPR